MFVYRSQTENKRSRSYVKSCVITSTITSFLDAARRFWRTLDRALPYRLPRGRRCGICVMSRKHTTIIIHYKYAALAKRERKREREEQKVKYSPWNREKEHACRRRRRRTSTLHAPRKYYPSHVFDVLVSSLFFLLVSQLILPPSFLFLRFPLSRFIWFFQTHVPRLSHAIALYYRHCASFSFSLFQPTLIFLPCFAHQSHRILLVFFSFVVCSSFSLSHSLVNIYLSYFLLLQGRLTLTFLTKLTGSWAPSVVTGSVERPTGSIASFCFPALLICPATPMPQGDAR